MSGSGANAHYLPECRAYTLPFPDDVICFALDKPLFVFITVVWIAFILWMVAILLGDYLEQPIAWLRGRLARIKRTVRKASTLPFGDIVSSSGGLQCVCPSCEYGHGTIVTFIDGMSEEYNETCKTCGTKYRALRIASVPQSARHDW